MPRAWSRRATSPSSRRASARPTTEVLAHLAHRLGCTVEFLRDGVDVDAELRARLDLDYAELTLRNGEPAQAQAAFERIAANPDVPPRIRWDARWGLARATEAQGDLDTAIEAYEHLETEAAERPLERPWLNVATALCRCTLEAGDVARATDIAERTLAEAESRGLTGSDAHAELLSTLVFCYYRRNDLVHATRLARDLIHLTDATGSRRARGAAYWNAAGVAEARGNLTDAITMAERAVALYAEDDDERSLARVSVAAAWFLLSTVPPQASKARSLLSKALVRLNESGSAVDRAYAHTEMSRAELLLGNPEKALKCASQAVELLGSEPRSKTATAHVAVADALHALGHDAEAAEHLALAEESVGTIACVAVQCDCLASHRRSAPRAGPPERGLGCAGQGARGHRAAGRTAGVRVQSRRGAGGGPGPLTGQGQRPQAVGHVAHHPPGLGDLDAVGLGQHLGDLGEGQAPVEQPPYGRRRPGQPVQLDAVEGHDLAVEVDLVDQGAPPQHGRGRGHRVTCPGDTVPSTASTRSRAASRSS